MLQYIIIWNKTLKYGFESQILIVSFGPHCMYDSYFLFKNIATMPQECKRKQDE